MLTHKKKGIGLIFIIFVALSILLVSVLALAEDSADNSGELTDDQKIDLAFDCLKNKVETKCSTLSVEEQIFSLLAISDSDIDAECKDALISESNNGECWPKSGCNLKETSLALLALDNEGENTDKIQEWLRAQTKSSPDLIWFLEIHSTNNEATTCQISYSGKGPYTINIDEEGEIDSGAGSCLALSDDNLFLRLSPSCFEKEITISCDKDFITTMIYKKQNSDVIYVSQNTHEASAGSSTQENVTSECFEKSGTCDYEGSLWATTALLLTNPEEDISPYLPYLIALEPDMQKFFPQTFLYLLLDYDEYKSEILNLQKNENFWDIENSYSKYYDSALAMWAFRGEGIEEFDNAKDYFLEHQDNNGCWGNVRDTAFILYSGWGEYSGNGAVEPPPSDTCTGHGYCLSSYECQYEAEGEILSDYFCESFSKVCCSKQIKEKTCSEKHGVVCGEGKTCSISTVTSLDEPECCLGICEPSEQGTQTNQNGGTNQNGEISDCESQGGFCRFECYDTEEEIIYDCLDSDKVCCKTKSSPIIKKKGLIWLIISLVILIFLVILGIIFRNKLKSAFFKKKTGFRTGPAPNATYPRGPSNPPMTPILSRPVLPRSAPVRRPRSSKIEKEMQDTLKKLKEMGK